MNEKIAERPIIFSPPMVRVILEGRKTMTRRVVKPQPFLRESWWRFSTKKPIGDPPATNFLLSSPEFVTEILNLIPCPYGKPGDRLWVRHNFWKNTPPSTNPKNIVAWDEITNSARWPTGEFIENLTPDTSQPGWRKCPSIHMPRWASRITLEITDIRVERVQEISRADAKAEGFFPGMNGLEKWDGRSYGNSQLAFEACWKDINGKKQGRSWDDNPWVWVISFRRA